MALGADTAVQLFHREALIDCVRELLPLAERHFAETARYREKGLSPDVRTYELIESAGNLRTYTVRAPSGELVGYCLAVVRLHHHSAQLRATEDLLYVRPESRGIGSAFVDWIDVQLAAEGVEAVYRSVQVDHDHGPMLYRLGYRPHEMVWSKPLEKDKPHG